MGLAIEESVPKRIVCQYKTGQMQIIGTDVELMSTFKEKTLPASFEPLPGVVFGLIKVTPRYALYKEVYKPEGLGRFDPSQQ